MDTTEGKGGIKISVNSEKKHNTGTWLNAANGY